MLRMGKTEEDSNGLKLGFLKTVQPNSLSKLIPAACNFKIMLRRHIGFLGSQILLFTWNFYAYFKFHSDWGRVIGKIKQNELYCHDTAPLMREQYAYQVWISRGVKAIIVRNCVGRLLGRFDWSLPVGRQKDPWILKRTQQWAQDPNTRRLHQIRSFCRFVDWQVRPPSDNQEESVLHCRPVHSAISSTQHLTNRYHIALHVFSKRW